MASDNHAHYSRIGFIVIAGACAIAATLVYMGGFHDPNTEFLAETYYDTPVSGLSVGSPVNLFGIKVGEVREISLAMATYGYENIGTNEFGRVCIVLALDKNAIGYDQATDEDIREFIRDRTLTGLRAVVASNGITGLARIDLKVVSDAPTPPLPRWRPRHPLILPSPSLMDNFAVAATKVMNKLKTIDLDESWSNLTRLVQSSARVAENVDALVESQRANVQRIVGDIGEASASIRELSAALKDNPSLIVRPSDPERLPETER